MSPHLLLLLLLLPLPLAFSSPLSSPLLHRFSDELREIRVGRAPGSEVPWPRRGTPEYSRRLVRSDLVRRNNGVEKAKYQVVYPSRGSVTMSYGNDFGWLHYTWINIGTPNVSFLVALDAGSDLTWVPCDCIACAPLSSQHNHLDIDLNMYSPTKSKTSKHLSCSHELCTMGSTCKSSKQPCPYNVTYYSENTSSLGLLVEDTLHLKASDSHAAIKASVIIGCGRKQSGGYMDGIAPDGLLGLGFGNISIPTFLSKEGIVPNAFSICFRDDNSGRIFFGDKGPHTQQFTPFVPLDGKYATYIVQVESFCVESKCLHDTPLQVLIDSGSSFTYLPDNVYKKVTSEFDKHMNGERLESDEVPWEFCYKSSLLELPKIPQVALLLAANQSFTINNPFFDYGKEGFCLAMQSSADSVGIIGQNFMTGYRLVFDREEYKLGWLHSDCSDLDNSSRLPLTPSDHRPENPLPTNEQQGSARSHAVSPAEAGRAPRSSARRISISGFSVSLLLICFSVIFGG